MEINLIYMLEAESQIPEAAEWRPLLAISGQEEAYKKINGEEVTAKRAIDFLVRSSQHPGLHPQQPAARPRERPGRARSHLAGDVGVPEPALARYGCAATDAAGGREGARLLPRDPKPGRPLPRPHGEHHDAGRGVRLLPARILSRAFGHDRADPRREVPPAAARPGDGRLGARLLPVGRPAAVSLGLRAVPAQVSHGHAPARRGRVHDPGAGPPPLAPLRHGSHAAGAGGDRAAGGCRRLPSGRFRPWIRCSRT